MGIVHPGGKSLEEKDKIDLTVIHKGKPMYKLNKNLLNKQDCWDKVYAILDAHIIKLNLYDSINIEKDPAALKAYAQNLTDLEFRLQALWGFPQDAKFHRFWDTPKCRCAKLDNSDNYPSGMYYISSDCPLHGV